MMGAVIFTGNIVITFALGFYDLELALMLAALTWATAAAAAYGFLTGRHEEGDDGE